MDASPMDACMCALKKCSKKRDMPNFLCLLIVDKIKILSYILMCANWFTKIIFVNDKLF